MTKNNTKHGLSKNAEIQYYVKRLAGIEKAMTIYGNVTENALQE